MTRSRISAGLDRGRSHALSGAVRQDIVSALVSAAIAAAILFVFFSLNYAALGYKTDAAKSAVRAAFASGELRHDNWRPGDTRIGYHQYNDCLILVQAIDQNAPKDLLALSPRNTLYQDSRSKCADLDRFARGDLAGQTTVFYHRYLHGHTLVTRLLLPNLGVQGTRLFWKKAIAGVLAAGVALALFGLARGYHMQASLFWLVVFMSFARFFGVETFDQSLSHGPSDLVFLSFALILASLSLIGGVGLRIAVPLVAVFGALTIIFEFLTGGIPLGLAIVAGGLPFALRTSSGTTLMQQAAIALAAFCSAIATGILVRIVVTWIGFGRGAVADMANQLGGRMGLKDGLTDAADTSTIQFVKRVFTGFDSLVPGTRPLAGLIFAISVIAGAWAAWQLRRRADDLLRARAVLLVASNVLIALCLLAFWQHTIVHAWFMDRTLCWTIASGFGLFAIYLTERANPTTMTGAQGASYVAKLEAG